MIVAVDFDGTLVTHRYPEIGEDLGGVPWLLELQARGVKLILLTMRSGRELEDAVAWCAGRGLKFWAVNDNPSQRAWTTSPKIDADLYVDDHAFGAPVLVDEEGRRCLNWAVAGPCLLCVNPSTAEESLKLAQKMLREADRLEVAAAVTIDAFDSDGCNIASLARSVGGLRRMLAAYRESKI